MSSRERQVLDYLLHARQAITIKTIAEKLDVSERTIHRDMNHIEPILFDYNLELQKQTGVGLRIIGAESDKEQLSSAIAGSFSSELTPEERQTMILSTLLEADEPIKLFTLAANLDVTTATVSHDLDQLEDDLTTYQLELIRKRGYGVRIKGDEKNKRAAMRYLIAKHVNPFELVSFLRNNKEPQISRQTDAISGRLLGLVNPEKLSIIEQKVAQAQDELRYELADSAYIGLVVHLALAIERLQNGDTIEFDKNYMEQINQTIEYNIAKRLIQDLEEAFDMIIPNDEIGYITMHLMGAKIRADQHYLIEDSSLDVAYQAKAIIRHVSRSLGKDLTHNIPLLNDLVAHLKPSIYRLKQGLTISNPMLDEIRQDYYNLFEIVQDAANAVFPAIDFPEDEIAYLVLHFASILLQDENHPGMRALVICSSGIGTAKMLATKLKQQIPEIKQVENKSMFDLEQTQVNDYDVVISTIPLNNEEYDYFLTSPMLTKAEANDIKQAVRSKKTVFAKTAEQHEPEPDAEHSSFRQQLEKTQTYTAAILDVLKSLDVRQLSGGASLSAVMQKACDQLATRGIIRDPENVKQALVDRQAKSGLGIPGTHLALYHTRSHIVAQPSFTVYSLDQPLTITSMDGTDMSMRTLLLMLAPKDAEQHVLETLSFLSSLMIEDKSIQVLESGDADQIDQYLSKQFYKWLHGKM
ncbi:BglG family transcription antiterminator [Lentibacillus halodurans]|nr:BglG family transcription antiterminator [Lentibacillus halodurans]